MNEAAACKSKKKALFVYKFSNRYNIPVVWVTGKRLWYGLSETSRFHRHHPLYHHLANEEISLKKSTVQKFPILPWNCHLLSRSTYKIIWDSQKKTPYCTLQLNRRKTILSISKLCPHSRAITDSTTSSTLTYFSNVTPKLQERCQVSGLRHFSCHTPA